MKPTDGATSELVVRHVRGLIEQGQLRPGDRLPPERELAVQLGVSRPERPGGAPVTGGDRSAANPSRRRHVHHGRSADARQRTAELPRGACTASRRTSCSRRAVSLEVGVAAFAAERASDEQIATIAEEVTGMFASIDDPHAFLVHDIRFHRADRGGVRQSDPGLAGRDDLGALLRAAPEDRAPGARPEGSRADAPDDLPRGTRARSEARTRGDARASRLCAAGAGDRAAQGRSGCDRHRLPTCRWPHRRPRRAAAAHAMAAVRTDRPRPRLVHAPLR